MGSITSGETRDASTSSSNYFNTLLPLPENVALIIGTQRVDDAQLPKKLLVQAKAADWVEIPAMDVIAVHVWVVTQDQARPLMLQHGGNGDRSEEIDRIGEALWKVSGGHPLHLIYAMESFRLCEIPISADAVLASPACPDGDIRAYYNSLWVTLAPDAKRILHALAGSQFAWPARGLRQCFRDFTAVARYRHGSRYSVVMALQASTTSSSSGAAMARTASRFSSRSDRSRSATTPNSANFAVRWRNSRTGAIGQPPS